MTCTHIHFSPIHIQSINHFVYRNQVNKNNGSGKKKKIPQIMINIEAGENKIENCRWLITCE